MKILFWLVASVIAIDMIDMKYYPGLLLSVHNEVFVQGKLAYGTYLQRALNDIVMSPIPIPNPKNSSEIIGTLEGCDFTIGNITFDMIKVDL